MLNVGVLVLIRHLADIMRRVILRKESAWFLKRGNTKKGTEMTKQEFGMMGSGEVTGFSLKLMCRDERLALRRK